jgi:twitching motility protein PilT
MLLALNKCARFISGGFGMSSTGEMDQVWTMDELFREMVRRKASDLILTVGTPPQFRINGALEAMPCEPLNAQTARRLAYSLINEEQIQELDRLQSCDFSTGVEGLSRFRIHIYRQRDSFALAARSIPLNIPDFKSLGIPEAAREFITRPHGLLLVTGPAGSGKSTTLACLVNLINQTRHAHIVCIENPIEYLHHHQRGVVDQREVHRDTPSFENALRAVFRESPDVIMVGEMRDLETIRLALTLAETGHLILATLHTQDATHAVHRIVDVFPADQQQQINTQLSLVLVGVLSQLLLPSADGRGLVLATEVMNVNSAIRNLIRERQLQQIYSVIQTSQNEGMTTMTDSLFHLCESGRITPEAALHRSPRPKELAKLLGPRALTPPPLTYPASARTGGPPTPPERA